MDLLFMFIAGYIFKKVWGILEKNRARNKTVKPSEVGVLKVKIKAVGAKEFAERLRTISLRI